MGKGYVPKPTPRLLAARAKAEQAIENRSTVARAIERAEGEEAAEASRRVAAAKVLYGKASAAATINGSGEAAATEARRKMRDVVEDEELLRYRAEGLNQQLLVCNQQIIDAETELEAAQSECFHGQSEALIEECREAYEVFGAKVRKLMVLARACRINLKGMGSRDLQLPHPVLRDEVLAHVLPLRADDDDTAALAECAEASAVLAAFKGIGGNLSYRLGNASYAARNELAEAERKRSAAA